LIANLLYFPFTVPTLNIYFTDSLNDARSKLPSAMLKSDVSSADDIIVDRRKKYKYDSLSPADVKHRKKQKKTGIFEPKSCPPRYIITDVQKSIHF